MGKDHLLCRSYCCQGSNPCEATLSLHQQMICHNIVDSFKGIVVNLMEHEVFRIRYMEDKAGGILF